MKAKDLLLAHILMAEKFGFEAKLNNPDLLKIIERQLAYEFSTMSPIKKASYVAYTIASVKPFQNHNNATAIAGALMCMSDLNTPIQNPDIKALGGALGRLSIEDFATELKKAAI